MSFTPPNTSTNSKFIEILQYFFFSRHREIIQSGEEGQQSILANIRSNIETEKERCIAKEAELEVSNAQGRLQY